MWLKLTQFENGKSSCFNMDRIICFKHEPNPGCTALDFGNENEVFQVSETPEAIETALNQGEKYTDGFGHSVKPALGKLPDEFLKEKV